MEQDQRERMDRDPTMDEQAMHEIDEGVLGSSAFDTHGKNPLAKEESIKADESHPD